MDKIRKLYHKSEKQNNSKTDLGETPQEFQKGLEELKNELTQSIE